MRALPLAARVFDHDAETVAAIVVARGGRAPTLRDSIHFDDG